MLHHASMHAAESSFASPRFEASRMWRSWCSRLPMSGGRPCHTGRHTVPHVRCVQGGYNLAATAAGVEATLRVLLGERPLRLPQGAPSRLAMMTIHQAVTIQAWSHKQPHVPSMPLQSKRWKA